jgi:Protein of unknown function (DUF1580)
VSTLQTERLVSLEEARQYLPGRRGGRPNRRTVWRYAVHGLTGVRLESLRVGFCHLTSVEACERFTAAVATARAARRQSHTCESPSIDPQGVPVSATTTV